MDFLRGHALPRAQSWQRDCAALEAALARGEDAAEAWRQAALGWSSLAGVSTGPLTTRRSAQRIDFQPVRIPMLEAAIAQAPAGEAALALIGKPAKGLPALEWLLFAPAAPKDPAAHAYARELARDLRNEADRVTDGFKADLTAPMDEAVRDRWFSAIVNQWIGSLEQMRMQRLLRPVEDAKARGKTEPVALRPYARTDAQERHARWKAIAALTITSGEPGGVSGQVSRTSIEAYLRGLGKLDPLADRLRRATLEADRALRSAQASEPEAMRRAAKSVGNLLDVAQNEVAPALHVRVRFSDSDGD